MENKSKFKKDDIIVVLKDFFIPGTGVTFSYYKGHKYKLECILKWQVPVRHEVNLITKIERKKKIIKINNG